MTVYVAKKLEVDMDLIRSEQSRSLLKEALTGMGDDNLVNISFMISPEQKAVIQQLSRENRLSQGVILRFILDEWMEGKLNGS